MTQAAVVIDIPSLIRRESRRHNECHENLTRRYQLPEHCYPSYLRHPNQPLSSPSTISSSSLQSSPSSSSLSSFYQDQEEEQEENKRQQQNELHLHSISIEDEEVSVANDSSILSVDGDFDTRIDIIQPAAAAQQLKPKIIKPHAMSSPSLPFTNSVAGLAISVATAPPLSDDEIERESFQQQQQQQKEEEVCIICYETFEQPPQQIHGRNYTTEELEEIEGKEIVSNFCLTCKYNVHHRCIDEYRLSKMTDIIRSGYQRGYIQSPNISGIFTMKCLMCSKEVEKIHISANGDIDIEKIQPGANEQNRQELQQQQIEAIMQNRIQRRLRRRQRLEFCRKKICSICMMFLVTITLLVFIFRAI